MSIRRLLTPLIVATVVLTGMAPAVLAAGADPFKGSWSAIDGDGSRMTVSFSGSGTTRSVTLFDERTTCLGGDPMTASALGTISGNTISGSVVLADECGGEVPFLWTHDAGTGTLSDGLITWYRGDRGPDAFSGVWIATDLDGSFMKMTFEGSGLTRGVSFFDDGASVCGLVVDGEGINWTGEGVGYIGSTVGFGRFIEVELTGGCAGSAPEPVATQTFEYDFANNQLHGPLGFDVTWSRK